MCALETPADLQSDGAFLRPSHADVVNSRPGLSEAEENDSRGKIYNQIKEQGTQLKSEDVQDCDLHEFLPQVAKA